MKKNDIEFLIGLQHKLKTQPNDGNADPVFWGVIERKRMPTYPGCGDGIELVWGSECCFPDDEIEELKKRMRVSGDFEESVLESIEDLYDAQEIIEKAGYDDCDTYEFRYEDVLSQDTGAFLTKEACEHHIKINGHNLCNPRTYAMTACRNFEFEELLRILKTADFTALLELNGNDSTAKEQMKKKEE